MPPMKNLHKHNHHHLSFIYLLLTFATSVLVGACSKGSRVFHAYRPVPEQDWSKQDTLSFTLSVPDSFTRYRLSVEVRNLGNYPYRNLPLRISSTPAGAVTCDTLQLLLADAHGHWLGKGWGALYQTAFPAGYLCIDSAGTYQLHITHSLSDSLVKGICDVGIRLESLQKR